MGFRKVDITFTTQLKVIKNNVSFDLSKNKGVGSSDSMQ